jgi:hypothetical protein
LHQDISLALWKAQRKMKAATKDSTNPHFRSKYADLGSVIDAVKEALSSEGIVFLQGVHDAVDGVAVETMLLHIVWGVDQLHHAYPRCKARRARLWLCDHLRTPLRAAIHVRCTG